MSTSKIEYSLIGYKFEIEDWDFAEKLEEIEYDILRNKELNPDNIRILYDSGKERFLGIILKEVDNEEDYGSEFEISLSYLKEQLEKYTDILEGFVMSNNLDFIKSKIDGYVVTLYH